MEKLGEKLTVILAHVKNRMTLPKSLPNQADSFTVSRLFAKELEASMNIQKFVISVVVASIIFFIFDLAWHQILMSNVYNLLDANIMRKHILFIPLIVNNFYRGFIYTLTYCMLIKQHASIIRGVIFGILIGLLLSSVNGLNYAFLSIQNIHWVWFEASNFVIQGAVAGLMLALIAKKNPKPKKGTQ